MVMRICIQKSRVADLFLNKKKNRFVSYNIAVTFTFHLKRFFDLKFFHNVAVAFSFNSSKKMQERSGMKSEQNLEF